MKEEYPPNLAVRSRLAGLTERFLADAETLAKGGEENMMALHMVSFGLVVVGAVNWGLVGLGFPNVVEAIFGGIGLTNIVYILVGVSGVWLAATHMKDCKLCSKK